MIHFDSRRQILLPATYICRGSFSLRRVVVFRVAAGIGIDASVLGAELLSRAQSECWSERCSLLLSRPLLSWNLAW